MVLQSHFSLSQVLKPNSQEPLNLRSDQSSVKEILWRNSFNFFACKEIIKKLFFRCRRMSSFVFLLRPHVPMIHTFWYNGSSSVVEAKRKARMSPTTSNVVLLRSLSYEPIFDILMQWVFISCRSQGKAWLSIRSSDKIFFRTLSYKTTFKL